MSDTLRDGIIATVVGGLILSLVLWLFGLLVPVGRWLGELPSHISRLFRRSRHKRKPAVATAAPSIKPVPPADVDPQLDKLQSRIMGVFAKNDGGRFNVVEMSYYMVPVSKLRIEAALEGLSANGLVTKNLNYVHGTSYGLTSRGRDFLIKKGAV